jgi:drug/metabolite transporter (DMT)-like permease
VAVSVGRWRLVPARAALRARLDTEARGRLAAASRCGRWWGGALLIAVYGAVFAALAQVFVRRLVMTETTSAIVFWFSATATILSLVTLPFGWVVPGPAEALMLVAAGLLGGVGQILLTTSYREADASVVAPFEYVSMLFALAFGYLLFDEVPTLTMLTGALLIVTAGILIIWRERQLGLERARQRKAMTPQG